MDMGTQGSGRKRLPNRERLTAEDDALNQIAREAEARLAAKRAARAEAREIRMKELERQQKEVEEKPEKDFTEKGSRNMPSLSAATLASLGGTSSRRDSGDTSISMDTEASMREIKDSLAEVEEKYKKAMVSNAQLDNEKTNFMYQVDTLKDMLLELEEQLAESRRQYEEKNKEFEREKHAHSILQFQFAEVKEALKQREEMLEKHGIILSAEVATNGETSDALNNVGYQGFTKMTKEELNALKSTGDGTLELSSEAVDAEKLVSKLSDDFDSNCLVLLRYIPSMVFQLILLQNYETLRIVEAVEHARYPSQELAQAPLEHCYACRGHGAPAGTRKHLLAPVLKLRLEMGGSTWWEL